MRHACSTGMTYDVLYKFLPRDAMRKYGLCCRTNGTVSVCLSVYHVRILYLQLLKIPPNCFLVPVALTPSAGTQFQGEPIHRGVQIHEGGEILRFSTEIAVYLGNGTR